MFLFRDRATTESTKSSSQRQRPLMLKVAKNLDKNDEMEGISAAVLTEELNNTTGSEDACESLIWGSKENSDFVTCSFRK